MFYSKAKKEALSQYEKAKKEYESTYKSLETLCGLLYSNRTSTASLILKIEDLINSIANTPKELEHQMATIKTHKEKFRQTEAYAKEAQQTLKKSSMGAAAGIAGGAAIASFAPTAAMWVATTFGTASTGTAISALSGAAATNAALAWLGGGTLAAGGAGIAGGSAFLALAGPIGWSIAGLSTVASLGFISRKNKKVADEATQAAKSIRKARGIISDQVAKVRLLNIETEDLLISIRSNYVDLKKLANQDYLTLDQDQQLALGTLVNNAASAAELMNRTL